MNIQGCAPISDRNWTHYMNEGLSRLFIDTYHDYNCSRDLLKSWLKYPLTYIVDYMQSALQKTIP